MKSIKEYIHGLGENVVGLRDFVVFYGGLLWMTLTMTSCEKPVTVEFKNEKGESFKIDTIIHNPQIKEELEKIQRFITLRFEKHDNNTEKNTVYVNTTTHISILFNPETNTYYLMGHPDSLAQNKEEIFHYFRGNDPVADE